MHSYGKREAKCSSNNFRIQILMIFFVFLLLICCNPCFGNDLNEINFTTKNLSQSSTKMLLEILKRNPTISEEVTREIVNELAHRKAVKEMVKFLLNVPKGWQRKKIILVLYGIEDNSVEKVFKRLVSREVNEENYFVLNYLAKKGDKKSLSILNRNFGLYPISSFQWVTTIRLFGKYHYIKATKNLLNVVNASNLNVADAAIESLLEMYPFAPKNFQNYEEAKTKLTEYLKQIKAI